MLEFLLNVDAWEKLCSLSLSHAVDVGYVGNDVLP